jgi:peptide deformylase
MMEQKTIPRNQREVIHIEKSVVYDRPKCDKDKYANPKRPQESRLSIPGDRFLSRIFQGHRNFESKNYIMELSEMLMLGDPRLYQVAQEVLPHELDDVRKWAEGLDSIILQFRHRYGAGRAVAAPQLGILKRLVCMHIDTPVVMINPVLSDMSKEMFELWDDCMCFPNLLVKVSRHRSCTLHFLDLEWNEHTWHLQNDLSELLQHEVDHLDGILATQRAIDAKAFRWR